MAGGDVSERSSCGVPSKRDPRIIVLFGNTPLLGNERANIETMRQLRDGGAEILFLVRREWAGDIHAELRRLGLPYRFCPYYDAVRHGVGLWVWLRNIWGILAGSSVLLWHWARWRPTHIHLGSTAWALNFWPALLLMGTPLVFRAGELPAYHHAVWRRVWSFVARRASVCVCDSHFIEHSLSELGVPSDRLTVVYAPAPDRSTDHPAETSLPKLDDESLTVLFVGQVTEAKGVGALIEAFLKLADDAPFRLIVAGDVSWKNPFAEGLIERIERAGLSERVQFPGFVRDIGSLYGLSDLHVAPSIRSEAYGLTVVEAKSQGIPSVVFPSGGLIELVQHGVDGWVCERPDAACLEEALRFYLDNRDVLARQGAAAKASLTERLKVQEYGARWRAIYDEVAR